MNNNCFLSALSSHVPENVLTNEAISRIVDTSNQWIVERTGIRQRRKIGDKENASDLGLAAARKTLREAGLSGKNLTHIIAATCTPDYLSPSVACIIGGQIEAGPLMAFDMQAACTGFIYGLSLCASLLESSPDSKILLVCTEALTRRLNWLDRSTCVLFGDAACACLFSTQATPGSFKIVDSLCQSDGQLKELILVGGGTSCQYQIGQETDENFFLSMQGRDTYRHAVRQMVNVCQNLLQRNQIGIEDINLFVPHQANMRIIEAVGQRLNIPMEKVFTNVGKYGNTSAASIPLALKEAMDEKRIEPGALILITAFGAGLTWGAALLKYHAA